MIQARVNLITADPDRMADTIGYIKTSVRPAVDSMDGSLGLSLYANAEIGVAVLEAFWAARGAYPSRPDGRARAHGGGARGGGHGKRRALPGSGLRAGGAAGHRGGAPA